MSKRATESMLAKINTLLGIDESYKAPAKMLEILSDEQTAKECFFKFLEAFDYDLGYEWFNQYFEDEHADRKNKKQDFTPTCLSKLISEMNGSGSQKGVIYEPAAGTGSTIISHWNGERLKTTPWGFNPLEYLYICEELSDKTVPFLLFNIMIRGINAVVIHGNTLTREAKNVYHCLNHQNQAMCFADLYKLPKNKRTEEMFGVKFAGGAI